MLGFRVLVLVQKCHQGPFISCRARTAGRSLPLTALPAWCISFTLGFQKEADCLLSVTKLSTVSDSKNTKKAREILLKLAEETAIFPTGWELSERYLFVVVSGCVFSSVLILLSLYSVYSSFPHQQQQHSVREQMV